MTSRYSEFFHTTGALGRLVESLNKLPGVGPKTAQKLLEEYKTIESILEHAGEAKNKRVRAGLENGKDLIHLSRELVTIHCGVPIEFHIEELIRSEMDIESLSKDFQDLEIHQSKKHLIVKIPII